MTHVLRMSTDHDIITTGVSGDFGPTTIHSWATIAASGCNIPDDETVVVVAHGNSTEIGDEDGTTPNSIGLDAESFVHTVNANMSNGAQPAAIYISVCGEGLAEFAAGVRVVAKRNGVWANTKIYGHCQSVSGNVPPRSSRGDMGWTEIFAQRRR